MSEGYRHIIQAYDGGHIGPVEAIRALVEEIEGIELEIAPYEAQLKPLRQQIEAIEKQIRAIGARAGETVKAGRFTVRYVEPSPKTVYDSAELDNLVADLVRNGQFGVAERISIARILETKAAHVRIERGKV